LWKLQSERYATSRLGKFYNVYFTTSSI
jgi:hypothetical protein